MEDKHPFQEIKFQKEKMPGSMMMGTVEVGLLMIILMSQE